MTPYHSISLCEGCKPGKDGRKTVWASGLQGGFIQCTQMSVGLSRCNPLEVPSISWPSQMNTVGPRVCTLSVDYLLCCVLRYFPVVSTSTLTTFMSLTTGYGSSTLPLPCTRNTAEVTLSNEVEHRATVASRAAASRKRKDLKMSGDNHHLSMKPLVGSNWMTRKMQMKQCSPTGVCESMGPEMLKNSCSRVFCD